jgi:hypothetical protein
MLLKTGEKLNIADELRKHEGNALVTIPVTIDSKDASQSAYLHAYRLPEVIAAETRRKMRKQASKRSRPAPRANTLYLAGWTLVLTSFKPEQVSAETIGKVYKARWQIELVIKRLKSVLNIDALRARRGSQLAQVYLLGKSFYALMVEIRALKLLRSREVEWRLWRIIADQIRGWITLADILDPEINRHVLKVLKERPRKRRRLRAKIAGIAQQLGLNIYAIGDLQP